jgi:hypothetical protein
MCWSRRRRHGAAILVRAVSVVETGGLAVLLSLVPATLVVCLKGRWTILLAGICLLFPLLWYGAFAPANPASWWARTFYDSEKMQKAARYQQRWSRTFAE